MIRLYVLNAILFAISMFFAYNSYPASPRVEFDDGCVQLVICDEDPYGEYTMECRLDQFREYGLAHVEWEQCDTDLTQYF